MWIRKQALSVLIYEGIVSDIFDYDYAPQSTLVENRRVWVNVSQEGQSDLEFLREEELLNALMLSSKSYSAGVCYQISDKGRQLIEFLSRREKEIVDLFAHKEGSRELLKVVWDGNTYCLRSPSGYERPSSVTDTEDVSYVSSAYIPQCLRFGGRPTMSNAHKARSSGMGAINTIRDDLDEVITLNSVSLIVAEYIPFGSNQIVQLNNTLGSNERVQGGFIAPVTDENCAGTSVEMSPELTSVDILDYTLTNHINFEAEIRFAEDPGIVQVETFGASLNAEGTCFFGMQIEAVMDRIKDKISLDHISRILVDVQQDSSKIVDSIISHRQRDLLNLIFIGDSSNRNKFNLIIANEITPHLTAEEYMDKGEFENEIKQIIGDTKAAYDISEKDTLIFGAHGLLVCGPHARSYEALLCAYMQFVTLDIFLQNYFARMWIMNDDLKTSDSIIDTISSDPNSLNRVRNRIHILSKELVQMEEILGYIIEALQIIGIPPEPQEQTGRSLYQRLEIMGMRSQLVRRSTDVKKNVEGAKKYLDILRERVSIASEEKMSQLERLEQSNMNLQSLIASNIETSQSLKIFQVMVAGMVTFDFLDRITGDWTVMDTDWMKNFADSAFKENALVWFFISILMWVAAAMLLFKLSQKLKWRNQGLTTIKILINRQINVSRLKDLFERKQTSSEERQEKDGRVIVKFTYQEPEPKDWSGTPPIISLKYDERNQYLLEVSVQYNPRRAKKDGALEVDELKDRILRELDHQRIYIENDSKDMTDALAIEKREHIQRMIDASEEDDNDENMKGEHD